MGAYRHSACEGENNKAAHRDGTVGEELISVEAAQQFIVDLPGGGDPSGAVEVRVYDEAGEYVGTLSATLDATGWGVITYRGEAIGGNNLGTGTYRAIAKGGGVNCRRTFVIVRKRGR